MAIYNQASVALSGSSTPTTVAGYPLLGSQINLNLVPSGSSMAIQYRDTATRTQNDAEVIYPRPGGSSIDVTVSDKFQAISQIEPDRFDSTLNTILNFNYSPNAIHQSEGQLLKDYWVEWGQYQSVGVYASEGANRYRLWPGWKSKYLGIEDYPIFTRIGVEDEPVAIDWVSNSNHSLGGTYQFQRYFIPGQWIIYTQWLPLSYSAWSADHLTNTGTHFTTSPRTIATNISVYGVSTRHWSRQVEMGTQISSESDYSSAHGFVDHRVFYACESLGKYVFYFLNEEGGYDYWIPGVVDREVRTDNISRLSYRPARNTTSDYQMTIKTQYKIKTGMITKRSELLRVQDLLRSPAVWLHDLTGVERDQDTMSRVLIRTNSVEYKTYRNSGKRWPSYEFTIELPEEQLKRI